MENKNIQSFKEFNENLNISDVNDSEKSKKEWWDKNYQKLIDLDIPYEDWKIIIKHKSDFDGVYNSTAKHRALYLLNTYSIEELENLINDYSFDDKYIPDQDNILQIMKDKYGYGDLSYGWMEEFEQTKDSLVSSDEEYAEKFNKFIEEN